MKTSQSNQYASGNERDTDEKERPVSTTIKTIRDQDCDKLQGLIGGLAEAEEHRKGSRQIFELKKCCFVGTEYNYQIYRNLELCVGVELTQASIEIKQDIANDIALGDSLAAALKNVGKATKDAKQKFSDLRKAACDLNICRNDKCNCTQILILTGKSPCEGDEQHKKPGKPACPEAEHILTRLVEEPEYFFKDSDVIFNAAADITGIQTFTNIKSLNDLQQTLTTYITEFETSVKGKITQGTADLNQCQTDLNTVITDLTKSEYALYNKRDEVDAEKETIEYLCRNECDCINEESKEHRLKKCKNEICEICEQLDDIYCERDKQDQQRKAVEM
jgi:hypothetical protein